MSTKKDNLYTGDQLLNPPRESRKIKPFLACENRSFQMAGVNRNP